MRVGAGGCGANGTAPGQTAIGAFLFAPVDAGGVNCYGAYDSSSCYSDPVFLQPPPPATATLCGDPPSPQSGNRGALIQGYITYNVEQNGVPFVPTCSDFTNNASTANFSFAELTVNADFRAVTLGGVNCCSYQDTSSCYSGPASLGPEPPAVVTPIPELSHRRPDRRPR